MPGETRGERPISSVSSFGENKPGILCWLIITNKTHNNSFPSPAGPGITPCSPCLASPAPASSWKQRNEFIIHQKGSEQLDRGSHNIAIRVSAAPRAWHGSLLTTASISSLPAFYHFGITLVIVKMPNQSVSLYTGRALEQQTSQFTQ